MMTRRTFLAASGLAGAQPGRRRPNFIILFADDMGYGDLGCYGHDQIRTPNLDRMAAEGARLTSYYSAASVCTPSRVGLLTGRYPMRAGQPNNFGPDSQGGLRTSEILLPQVLKPAGYRTMIIGKWHLGHQPAEFLPTSRGFDHYFGLPYSNDMIGPWVKTDRPLMLYRDGEKIETVTDQSRLTQRYTAEAVKFIQDGPASQPFFLYVPYAMPHLPLAVAPERRGKSPAGLYGDVIEEIDWSAGEILRAVRERGIDADTMVLFLSDNGPWNNLPARMLQKGNEWWHTGSRGPLRGAKGGSYEGGFRVPGIVRWPGRVPPGQVLREMASGLDWFPTIVSAAGGRMPSDRAFDGFDLLPMLADRAPSPRREFFYFRGPVLEAVRQGPWKLRRARTEGIEGIPPAADAPAELFHVERDVSERYNQAAAEPAIAAKLDARLREFAQELHAYLAAADR